MRHMTTYKFGDVILVPFPFTDQSTSKKRPAIVISSDNYNQNKPDIILIAVTSQLNVTLRFGEVLIDDWAGAGLIKPSVVKPIITTLQHNLVIKTLGKLQSPDFQALENVLQQIINV
jgi:mRNA interferase MazF